VWYGFQQAVAYFSDIIEREQVHQILLTWRSGPPELPSNQHYCDPESTFSDIQFEELFSRERSEWH